MQTFQWDRLTMGVCYYPEHWDRSLWESDLRRMRAAGIEVVRIAEFSWTLLEPEEGTFRFDLFDDFLALCERTGMRVILGTPTATPPAWLTERYPDTLNALPDGTLLRHGGRRHYTYNSPTYRRLASRIVTEMAKRWGRHPAVVGWQIDNELNCETDEFYSEADHAAFRTFLQEKYGTLGALNRAWGTAFWSETYTDWAQVHCPRPVLHHGDNPHLKLDYARFVSHSCLSFAKMQADILRQHKKPNDFITTNGMFGNLDNHAYLDGILDVYTYDSYPDFALALDRDPKTATDLNDRKWSKNLIETRSVCPHFGIMEQQSGAGGWVSRMEMPAPRPGQLTLWAMQSVAHGADFISFFRWRTACFGTELYWHGILDYDNRDNRKLREVTEFGTLLRTLAPVCGADHAASFALVKDYDNEWDRRADAWHERIAHRSEGEIFAAAQLSHTPFDILYLKDDTDPEALRRYALLVYAHPMILTEQRAKLLEAYVAAGGTLVVGCRAGLKDIDGHAVMLPQPGLLANLCGTDVRDFTFAAPAEPENAMDWDGERLPLPVFHDILTPLDGTTVLARYTGSYYAGEAALTAHSFGAGTVLHLGSCFDRATVRRILEYCGAASPLRGVMDIPEAVELVLREKGDRRFAFLLNYTDAEQTVTLHQPMKNLYTGERKQGAVILPPFGTAVYEMGGHDGQTNERN